MFAELVRNARTHRRFDEARRISEDELKQLVDCARLSPCAGNFQPLRFRIISSPAECAAMFPCTAWAGAMPDWPGPAEGERPTGYIVLLSEKSVPADAGIASAAITFAAHDMGYATCILGILKRPEIIEAFDIPQPYNVQLVIAVGAPGEKVIIDEVHEGDNLSYYRSDDNIHHVPKLSLESVLIR